MLLASTSLQPIGVKSTLAPSFVPTYCAYHGQTLGNTKNLHDAHCKAETIIIENEITVIDFESHVGIVDLTATNHFDRISVNANIYKRALPSHRRKKTCGQGS